MQYYSRLLFCTFRCAFCRLTIFTLDNCKTRSLGVFGRWLLERGPRRQSPCRQGPRLRFSVFVKLNQNKTNTKVAMLSSLYDCGMTARRVAVVTTVILFTIITNKHSSHKILSQTQLWSGPMRALVTQALCLHISSYECSHWSRPCLGLATERLRDQLALRW